MPWLWHQQLRAISGPVFGFFLRNADLFRQTICLNRQHIQCDILANALAHFRDAAGGHGHESSERSSGPSRLDHGQAFCVHPEARWYFDGQRLGCALGRRLLPLLRCVPVGLVGDNLSISPALAVLCHWGFCADFDLSDQCFFHLNKAKQGHVTSEMSPAVVVSGSPAEERFVLDRVPIPIGFLLVIEDKNPPSLETESRYAVGVDASGGTTTLQGRLRKTPRGLHELGPANIWYQDILGLTRISVANMATTTLKVLPQFRPLDVIEAPRSEVEEPDILTKPNRFASEDYFLFKEYVSGDDTRRINWRLSIRTGQLQIRKPESKEINSDTVLLALDAYFPSKEALTDAVGVEQVLDQLVEVWLSLAARMQEKGNHVRLVAYVKQEDGMGIEEVSCALESQTRWQDLGARACWQADVDVDGLIKADGRRKACGVVSLALPCPPILLLKMPSSSGCITRPSMRFLSRI